MRNNLLTRQSATALQLEMLKSRLPISQRSEIEKQVQKMLANDFIEPVNSEWSSPVLLVGEAGVQSAGGRLFRSE
ncbi:unnamed protein product [Pieris macdunnoughi]|uniref:Uncharacterized protein n=1 Tax=Pieris macdunnoughi TaxID=345717 RepID=A0A821UHW8_9NEOP|nr:unnamed protein product [Pieris macdunnoughi]